VTAPKLKQVPSVIGDKPPDYDWGILGTWQARDFKISSKGKISGKLRIDLDQPLDLMEDPDYLFIQLWAHYVWVPYGDTTTRSVGEFIPVEASQSSLTSSTFELNEDFELPPLMLGMGGGMPLEHLEIRMVWYRKTIKWFTGAEICHLEDFGTQPWGDAPIFDRTLSLGGKLNRNFRQDNGYVEWLRENIPYPTDTPVVYPQPLTTPTPTPPGVYPPPSPSPWVPYPADTGTGQP
jgi:hypothetical protein